MEIFDIDLARDYCISMWKECCVHRMCFYLPHIFEKRREVLFWGLLPSPQMFRLISQLLLKLAFFKFAMCNICINNIAKIFLDSFQI